MVKPFVSNSVAPHFQSVRPEPRRIERTAFINPPSGLRLLRQAIPRLSRSLALAILFTPSHSSVFGQSSSYSVQVTPILSIEPPKRAIIDSGTLAGLQRTHNGDLLVLRKGSQSIDRYDLSGEYKTSFPEGEIAGRHLAPRAFAVTSNGVVGLLDTYGQSVFLFRLHKGSEKFLVAVNLPSAPVSICAGEKEFFVSLGESDGAVYRVSEQGTNSLAFKVDVPHGIPEMQRHLHDQNLICFAGQRTVLSYSESMPNLAAYSMNGMLRWRTRLKGFKQLEIGQETEYRMRISSPVGGNHRVVAAFLADPHVVAIQLQLVNQGRDAKPNNETRFLSLDRGTELARTESLPSIATVSGRQAYGLATSFGRVTVYRYKVL